LIIYPIKCRTKKDKGEAFAPFNGDPNQYKKLFYIESYGCQMNFSDSEIVASILNKEGFGATRNFEDADLVLLNTCSIREKAEQTVRKRLTEFKKLKAARTRYAHWYARLYGGKIEVKIIGRGKTC
jgi:tRNA-2-methylthio-N6-dimethylallyladenosine synthase